MADSLPKLGVSFGNVGWSRIVQLKRAASGILVVYDSERVNAAQQLRAKQIAIPRNEALACDWQSI